MLSFEEVKVALVGKISSDEYEAVFKSFDADGNGTLDLKEACDLRLEPASWQRSLAPHTAPRARQFTTLCKALDTVHLNHNDPMTAATVVRQKSNSLVDKAWERLEQQAKRRRLAYAGAAALALVAVAVVVSKRR